MKKLIFTLIISIFAFSGLAQKDFTVSFNQPKSNSYRIHMEVANWKILPVTRNGVNYEKLVFSSSTVTEQKGWAELPFISTSIQLPSQKNVDLKIVSSTFRDIVLGHPLLPSRGTIYRNQNPDEIPYCIDDNSLVNAFYPEAIATCEEPFILRDVRGISVRIFPFQWNAVTKTLRIYTQIEFELVENNQPATNALLKENAKPIAEAIGMYQSVFLNFKPEDYNLPVAEYGDILVITTARDEAAIEPWIVWKKEKGFNVSKEVVPQGTVVTNLVQQKYNENNNLMYVLLVGDWEDVQSEGFTFEGVRCPTDPFLGCVAGSDNFPDLAVGRMSASNPDQVRIQVEKTIRYEKMPNLDPRWRETFIGIGSDQGEGKGDDDEIDSTHIQRIYGERLTSFTYNTHQKYYGPAASLSELINHINAGASCIAYCGHGTESSWYTTGYRNADINNSKNGENLPFIVSTACLNGAFHKTNDCFGETWLLKENGGALATWMSAITQPWTPPQRGQDYFFDVLSGGFNYNLYPGQNGISTNEQRTHWGSIATNAMALMLSESATNGDVNTVKTWITFGDPSVQLRTKEPAVLASSWNAIMQGGNYQTTITANGVPVKNAWVALSQNGVCKKGLTDESGKVSIEHNFELGDVLLVVTAFNTTTIYSKIPCISAGYPFITCHELSVNDDNGILDYSDKNVKLNFTARNVGSQDAGALTFTLSTNDPYISILNHEASCSGIASLQSVLLENGFEISVSEEIPDKHVVTFQYTVSGSSTWNGTYSLVAHAAVVTQPLITIDDRIMGNGNGQLNAGETALLRIQLTNAGTSKAINVKGHLVSSDPYLSILTTGEQYFGDIGIYGGTATLDFLVTASENTPPGHQMDITAYYTAAYGLSGEIPIHLDFSGDYCKPTSNCSSYHDNINAFLLEDIQNANSGCSGSGYGDFTSMSTVLQQGEAYDVTIETSSNMQYISLWIDFNSNHVFESSECLISNFKMPTAGSIKLPAFIPETVQNGHYRLRVKSVYNASSVNPCASVSYGETEDYTVIIDNGIHLPEPTDLQGTYDGNQITLSWKAPQGNPTCSYAIFRNNVRIGSSQTPAFIDENILNGKAHVYMVQAVYNEGVSEKLAGPAVVMVPFHEVPRNIRIDKNGSEVLLSWTAITQSGLSGYNIYRNDEKLNQALVQSTQFPDQISDNQTYCYQVVAVYNDAYETESETRCIQTVGTRPVPEAHRVAIFPNPASQYVNIVCEEVPGRIQLMNLYGQVVFTSETHEKEICIPVSSLPKGVYVVVVEIKKRLISKKLVIR